MRRFRRRFAHLQGVLLASSEQHSSVVLPGYTHLQQAQPVLFPHYALSLFWMLERDRGRLGDAWQRADFLPLGSGALAGSAFPLDRAFLARELGFSQVTPNSLDAVSDRDFLLETLSALAILMMHLSRFCEDLILWSSAEFGFVELDDHFATGSSMMPQKKKSGRARAGARQDRSGVRQPDGVVDDDEGRAVDVRQGSAGRQGAAL